MTVLQAWPDAEVTLSVLHRPTHTIVKLGGEIDIATTAVLRERLLRVLPHVTAVLVIDLSEVAFCDASGLAVMISAQRRARSLGIAVRLVSPQPQVTKLLRITGLDRSLGVYPRLHDAPLHRYPAPSPGR